MPLLMECTAEAPSEDADTITAGLVAFNRQVSGQPASEPVTVIVRDPANREVRGGLRGKFTHAWLHVDQLWLADDLRGSGLGAEILGRRLAKDFEATIASARAYLYAAAVMLLVRRIARSAPV